MSPARMLATGLALALVAACGSNEIVPDRYYSLVLAAGSDAPAAPVDEDAPRLVVGPIELPRYLDGRALSMQVAPNRIESASHHLWAEPLDESIAKVLVRDIAAATDGLDVERNAGSWTSDADCRLRVEFDAFHPTHRANVVARGRYWIVSGESSERHEFDFDRTLTADGYAHAVDVMRDMLDALAQRISGVVSEPGICSGRAASEESAPG